MADATAPCKTHNAVKWNRCEQVSQTKLWQNLTIIFRKFLNAPTDNTKTTECID